MRKIALLTAAVALLGLAAGCDDNATAAPVTEPSTASSPAAATPAPTASARTVPTTTAPARPVATTRPAPARADWSKKVKACPNDGQDVIIQKVVSGDLTGDGAADTVVARSCEARTSYWPSTVEVFDGATGSRIATLLSDDGPTYMPWVTDVALHRGTLTVEAAGNDAHGTQACADLGLTYTFKYGNGGLTRTDRVIGDAGKCQDVG